MILDEDGQVAHRAPPRGNPLRDLPLEHQDAAFGSWLGAQEPVQDRARDVIRQVRDDVEGRLDQPGQVRLEDVPGNEAERSGRGRSRRARPVASSGDRGCERRGEVLDHPAVELHGGDGGPCPEQGAGEDPQTGPDLEDRPANRRLRLLEDRLEHLDIDQEVLAEALLRTETGRAERPADLARIKAHRAQRVPPRVVAVDDRPAASRSAARAAS